MSDGNGKKSTGYQVDVAALSSTVAKLNAVSVELGNTSDCALYDTTIGSGTLGKGFAGAENLLGTHDAMQKWISQMVGLLQGFIDEYGGQTKQVADNYDELEHQTKQNMYSNG
ncbi:hypothetical protein GXW83_27980 [Streptacidiphilus sp. PB12-B1b]|uniref:hypothetical protein n=1 Tax=Streptacidiphilus sp. PB12-B1b TaxID=2705012 RepID=UPI0015F87EF7|nr:hypothetical protein [Streptacidiphilus sp. PB12-B1b]QMU78972.1 hypothetical protein GXW83_27980 [Streptacidiphilus sp. PB12-B1b]